MAGRVTGEMENKAIFQLEVEVEVGAWQFENAVLVKVELRKQTGAVADGKQIFI